jgi:hypothetical protein
MYTFTKSVKCFFDALPRQKKKPPASALDALPLKARRIYSNLWPCRVQFRMPHPVVQDSQEEVSCLYAEQFLRQEPNIFVQPYNLKLLPKHVQLMFVKDGGGWFHSKRLRSWKDDVTELGVLPDGIATAFESALNDVETPGILPANAMERGSLLKANFRIHGREGAPVRDGSLHFCSELPDRFIEELPDPFVKETDETNTELSAVVQIQKLQKSTPPAEGSTQEDSEEEYQLLEPVDPPFVPVPIQITDPMNPDCDSITDVDIERIEQRQTELAATLTAEIEKIRQENQTMQKTFSSMVQTITQAVDRMNTQSARSDERLNDFLASLKTQADRLTAQVDRMIQSPTHTVAVSTSPNCTPVHRTQARIWDTPPSPGSGILALDGPMEI